MMEEKKDMPIVKEKADPKVIAAPSQYQFNSVETAKIGEIVLSSEIIRADNLLNLIVLALSNKEVKDYLQCIELKKRPGNYIG